MGDVGPGGTCGYGYALNQFNQKNSDIVGHVTSVVLIVIGSLAAF